MAFASLPFRRYLAAMPVPRMKNWPRNALRGGNRLAAHRRRGRAGVSGPPPCFLPGAIGPAGRLRREKPLCYSARMSVDKQTVLRVARLARIAVTDAEAEALKGELNTILGFVEQLNEVDVTGIEPMTSVVAMQMKEREDRVTDGGDAERVLANAPARIGDFF